MRDGVQCQGAKHEGEQRPATPAEGGVGGHVAQVRTVVVAGRLISPPHSLRLLLQVFIVILLEGRDMGNRERSEGERGKEREKQGRETE